MGSNLIVRFPPQTASLLARNSHRSSHSCNRAPVPLLLPLESSFCSSLIFMRQRIVAFVAIFPIVITGESERTDRISKFSHTSVSKERYLFNLGTKQTQETLSNGTRLRMGDQDMDRHSTLPTRPFPPLRSFHPNPALSWRCFTICSGLLPNYGNDSLLLLKLLVAHHHWSFVLAATCTSATTDNHASSKISKGAPRTPIRSLLLLLHFVLMIAADVLLLFPATE